MNYSEDKIIKKVEEARRLYREKKYLESITQYRELAKMLEEDRTNLPVIQIELGWAYYNNEQYQQSIEMLEAALQSETLTAQQIFDCYRLLGFCRELSGNHQDAIRDLEKAVQIPVPEETKRYTYFELGKIFFTDGQMVEAEHYLRKARPLFSRQETSYHTAISYYIGFLDYFQKKFDSARQHFNEVIQTAEDHKTRASGYFGLTHLHYQKKEYPVLIDLCEKTLRIDNNFFDKETLGFFLCEAYYHLKEWEQLENFFDELKKNYSEGRYSSVYDKFEYAIEHKKFPPKTT